MRKEFIHLRLYICKIIFLFRRKGLIIEVNNTSDLDKLSNSCFVRFESKLERNPLISLLESFEQMMVVVMTFQSQQRVEKRVTNKKY